jgi:hypothetical protein
VRTILVGLLLALAATAGQGQWSEPVNVTRLPAGLTAYNPSLAVDSTGALHASWSLRLQNEYDWVDYSCKPADSDTWLTPVHVSRDSYPYRSTAIAIGPGGVPHILWQSEGEAGHLYVSYKSGDTWTLPERCTTWSRSGFGLRACADRQHRVHATWGDLDLHTIWYVQYDDSAWHVPEAAATDPGEIARPDVAADHDGYAHVVYQPPGAPAACAYVTRSQNGWRVPYLIRGIAASAVRPRICIDTTGQPRVAWYESRSTVLAGLLGDTWSSPCRLDSIDGFHPAVCADSFGLTHVVYNDGPGTREATVVPGEIEQTLTVDSVRQSRVEVACGGQTIHAILVRGTPNRDLWYGTRPLNAPGIAEEPVSCRLQVLPGLGRGPFTLRFALPSRSSVRISVWDAAGRCLYRRRLGDVSAGGHAVEVNWPSDRAGVLFCHVATGTRVVAVKVVRS